MSFKSHLRPAQFLILLIAFVIGGCTGGQEGDSKSSSDKLDPFASAAILELKIQAPSNNPAVPLRNPLNPVSSCSPLSAPPSLLNTEIIDCIDLGGVCSTGSYTSHIITWELKDPDNGNFRVTGSKEWEMFNPPVSANAQCIDGFFKLRVLLPKSAARKRYLLEASIFGIDSNGRLQGPDSNPSNVDSKMVDFTQN
ncbi:MAG: hypothetical protein R2827_02050 [Bdellovibrionales bacterium]